MSMSKVESLQNTFRKRERGEDDHDVEDLMAGTPDVECSLAPSLRNLLYVNISLPLPSPKSTSVISTHLDSVRRGTDTIQHKCDHDP